MSHMESTCRNFFAHNQWKEDKQANWKEKLLRKISCIRWYLWRKSTQLDIFLHHLTSGRELIHWKCSHRPFGRSVCTFSGWMRGHLFVFFACILGEKCDTSSYCERFGNLWLLEDAYNCLDTWESHLCHCSNKIMSFIASMHQLHNEDLPPT